MKIKIYITTFVLFLVACSNQGKRQKYLVQIQQSTFEISGNGSSLDFPVFPGNVSLEEIEKTINTAQQIHDKLSKIYDFKHFKTLGAGKWSGLVFEDMTINNGSPIMQDLFPKDDKNKFDVEIIFSSINNDIGEFTFRVVRKREIQHKDVIEYIDDVRYQTVQVRNGESVSVGSLYEEDGNKGFLLVLAFESIRIDPGATLENVLPYLQKSKLGRNDSFVENLLKSSFMTDEERANKAKQGPKFYRDGKEVKIEDLKNSKSDEFDNASTDEIIDLRNKAKESGATFTPYDSPPRPISDISPVFPESARKDSITGHVILQVFIKKDGKTGEVVVLKGIRDDLNNAAINAIQVVEWEPAKKDDEPVGVWISIPVNFQLK